MIQGANIDIIIVMNYCSIPTNMYQKSVKTVQIY